MFYLLSMNYTGSIFYNKIAKYLENWNLMLQVSPYTGSLSEEFP